MPFAMVPDRETLRHRGARARRSDGRRERCPTLRASRARWRDAFAKSKGRWALVLAAVLGGVVALALSHLVVRLTLPGGVVARANVRDTLELSVKKLRAPLHMTIPIAAKVPIKQGVHVTGQIRVPIHRRVPISLGALVIRPSPEPLHVTVSLPEAVAVHLSATLTPTVSMPDPVALQLEPLRIESHDVKVGVE
jgi:hypothetical protein